MRAFAKLTGIVDGEPRIISDPPVLVPVEELVEGARRRWSAEHSRSIPRVSQRHWRADRRDLLESYRFVASGAEGRRRRQRRHAGLDRPPARPRRRGPALPPDQGGSGVGARGLTPARASSASGQARGRGPAADAGRKRHLPRLGARPTASTARRATTTSASSGTGRHRSTWIEILPPGARSLRQRVRLDAGPSSRALRRPDRDCVATWGRETSSTRRSPTSPPAYADLNERDYKRLTEAAADGRIVAELGI